jgi:hypothetical protein
VSDNVRVFAAVVAFVLMAGVIVSLERSNSLQQRQNAQGAEADDDRLEARYERILLGCNSAGARESEDALLRHLCDVELLEVKTQLDLAREG